MVDTETIIKNQMLQEFCVWSAQLDIQEHSHRHAAGILHTLTGNLVPYQHLEGHGDLGSRLIIKIIRLTVWVIGVVNYLLSPPDPPSNPLMRSMSL